MVLPLEIYRQDEVWIVYHSLLFLKLWEWHCVKNLPTFETVFSPFLPLFSSSLLIICNCHGSVALLRALSLSHLRLCVWSVDQWRRVCSKRLLNLPPKSHLRLEIWVLLAIKSASTPPNGCRIQVRNHRWSWSTRFHQSRSKAVSLLVRETAILPLDIQSSSYASIGRSLLCASTVACGILRTIITRKSASDHSSQQPWTWKDIIPYLSKLDFVMVILLPS